MRARAVAQTTYETILKWAKMSASYRTWLLSAAWKTGFKPSRRAFVARRMRIAKTHGRKADRSAWGGGIPGIATAPVKKRRTRMNAAVTRTQRRARAFFQLSWFTGAVE